MATYRATSEWTLEAEDDFPKGRYSRGHSLTFGSGVTLAGTASRHVVGTRWAAPDAVDPEEMLVGAINACHMLSFLHVAREAGFLVTRYRDEAEGMMAKRDDGEMWVSKVVLRPRVTYEGRQPTADERTGMHHRAHEMCFIANSVKTKIVVEDVTP